VKKTVYICDGYGCSSKLIIPEENHASMFISENWEADGANHFCPECRSDRKVFVCQNCQEEVVIFTDDENAKPTGWEISDGKEFCCEQCSIEYYEDMTPEWKKLQDMHDFKANLLN